MATTKNPPRDLTAEIAFLTRALKAPTLRESVARLAERARAWSSRSDIDPSAPYACGIRAALPQTPIAVDHWHLVRLANEIVTRVRQRVAREQHGRRGPATDPMWAHRRILRSARDRLSRKQLDRLRDVPAIDDPTDEICAARATSRRCQRCSVAGVTSRCRRSAVGRCRDRAARMARSV
jgi:hypothetical protein